MNQDAQGEWLEETLREHNDRMNRASARDWNARHGKGRVLDAEKEVIDDMQRPAALPVAVPRGAGLVNPLEADPEAFGKALQVRTANRNTLVAWIRDALKKGVDFGQIHVVGRKSCDQGNDCTNPRHWSKDTLFKPGAEKICGMLAVTPHYPNLHGYEQAAISGVDIHNVILRCQICSIDGRVLSEGVGAASLKENGYSLNKTLKIAKKSAQIDAVLNLGGLSEVFTHPDNPPKGKDEPEEPDPTLIPAGKYKDRPWAEASEAYLSGVVASSKAPDNMRSGAQAELNRRKSQYEFDDDIPF